MEEKKQSMISEPDENGVRYYTIDRPQAPNRQESGEDWNDRAKSAPGGQGQGSGQGGADGTSAENTAAYPEQNGGGNGGNSGGSGYGGGKPRRNLKKPLIIFGCVLLAVIFLAVACDGLKDSENDMYADISEDHISILYLEGTISGEGADSLSGDGLYDQDWILNRIDDAMNNPNNKGLILAVNTPGGAVYETDEVYLKLKEYQNSTGRPLYSAMGSMAASGGYYISAPADKIIANRNCWTGSIGVTAGTVFDISEFLDKYGIKTVTITAGKNKAMGSMTEPLTKEQKEIYQSLVDEAYEQFTSIVVEGRDMKLAQVKKLADGRVYTAKQALRNGLIDEIGTIEDAVSDMRSAYGLADCAVYEMHYENSGLWDMFLGAVSKMKGSDAQGDAGALLEYMSEQGQMPISYMAEIRK